ncbi:MAG TPA: hypothetical protein VN181_14425 [Thermoanaerobaculia bacterium]|nr:hypothetical protein [Thermoanaerobaculia bacterium]
MNAFDLSSAAALTLVARIAAAGVAVACLELLVAPFELKDTALMSWPIFQTRHRFFLLPAVDRAQAAVFAYPNVLMLLGVRFTAAATTIFAASDSRLFAAAVAIVAATSLILPLRTSYGLDGADQMSTTIFVALSFAAFHPTPVVHAAVLWFLTLQACVAYFTAGAAKAMGHHWRDGSGLTGIFTTDAFGNRHLGALLRRSNVTARALSWSVIALECAFPLVLVAPVPAVWMLLAAAAAFHLATALIMGLNTFVFAYFALYPAVLYCLARA